MNISWYGQTCFEIVVQKGKNGPVSILTDPFGRDLGLKPPRASADIVVLSRYGGELIREDSFLIAGPGEYDVKGVYIEGIQAFSGGPDKKGSGKEDKTEPTAIFTIDAEEIRVCHLGFLGQKELSASQLEKIGDIDILTVPVGGGRALGAKDAVKIISQIEPSIVIPMHYHISGLTPLDGIKLEGSDSFLKALGIKSLEPLPKLSIKKKDILKEEAKVVALKV